MILIVDCYLDEDGGTPNFARQMGGRPWVATRPTREDLPNLEGWSAIFITGSGACLADGYEGEGLRAGWSKDLVRWTKQAVDAGIPLFGVCFGHQVLGAAFGATVRKAPIPEVGFKDIHHQGDDPLFSGLPSPFTCFVSHEDEVVDADELHVLAHTQDCGVHAIRVPGRRAWGVQFHSEMLLDEARRLLAYRAEKHPQLVVDVAAEVARSHLAAELAPFLFGRFLKLAGL